MKQESDLYAPPNVEWFDQEQWGRLQKRYQISPRELQVAKIVCCKGLNNKEIAKKLNIVPGTVKVHLFSIYRKIRVNSRTLMLLKFIEDVENIKQSASL